MAETPHLGYLMETMLNILGLPVRLRRSEQRRTLGVTIERDGSITATAPTSAGDREIVRLLESREVWLHGALQKHQERAAPAGSKEFVSGEGFYFLGRSHRLRVLKAHEVTVEVPPLRLFEGRFLLLPDTVPSARHHFIRWYSQAGQRWLDRHLPALSRRVGAEFKNVKVMELGYRWASCAPTGRLNFHWRTFMLPHAVITYIALHELCHLHEPNHGPAFWRLVRSMVHDYQTKERWLLEEGKRFGF